MTKSARPTSPRSKRSAPPAAKAAGPLIVELWKVLAEVRIAFNQDKLRFSENASLPHRRGLLISIDSAIRKAERAVTGKRRRSR
jgi:hypothetical protein